MGVEVMGSTEGVKGFLVEEGMVEDFSFFLVNCVGATASFFLFIGGVLVTGVGFLWALLVGSQVCGWGSPWSPWQGSSAWLRGC